MADERTIVYALFGLRVAIGTLLVLAGAAKIAEAREHRVAAVDAYRLLPRAAALVVGTTLPFVEVLLGVSLIVGFLMPLTAFGATALFAAFAVGMGVNLRRGRRVPCACFGVTAESTISWSKFVVDGGFMVLVALTTWAPSGWIWPVRPLPRGFELRWGDVAGLGLFATGTLALIALARMALELEKARGARAGHAHG